MKKYSELKLKSITLREEGLSYLHIAKKLKVSKSCIRNWTKYVKLPLELQNSLLTNHINEASNRLRSIQKNRSNTSKKTRSELDQQGKDDVENISDPLFFLGLGLYWGEGFKNKTQEIGIVNTDPRILHTSIAWFAKYYNISRSEYTARLSLNEDYRDKENSIIDFWIDELGLTKDQFTKTSFIKAKHKRTYQDAKYKGTLRIKIPKPIRVHNRIISSINNIHTYTK